MSIRKQSAEETQPSWNGQWGMPVTLKEDAKETREKAKAEQENAIQKRMEQREELEKRKEENRKGDTDAMSISESGKVVLSDKSDPDNSISAQETADSIKMESVIYTKTGEVTGDKPGANISVSV